MSTYEWSVVTGLETRAPPTSEVSLFIVLYPLEKKLSILGWGKNFFRAAKEVDYRRVFPQLCSPKEVFSSTNFINFTILQMNQCRQLTICWFKDLIMVKLIWNKFYQLYSILVMDTYCYWCSEASLSQGLSLVMHTINGENFLVSFGGYSGRYSNQACISMNTVLCICPYIFSSAISFFRFMSSRQVSNQMFRFNK